VKRRRSRLQGGAAAIEAALLLPLLVLLALPVADLARALQTHLVLVAISREGASMAARGSGALRADSQSIMDTLAASAPPLDMRRDGMLFVTRVMGSAGAPLALEQYRWLAGGLDARAEVARCADWDAEGGCAVPMGMAVLPEGGAPDEGEVVHAFEARYRFRPWFPLLPGLETEMHALTIF
jgi:Flp pilus assembly protein TadG